MRSQIPEANYPATFREETTKKLAEHLKLRHSVVLIGTKRVGISNFLRFFINQPQIKAKHLGSQNHLFIPVDLNDLVERELYPFWVLTLKRVVDNLKNISLTDKNKRYIEQLFLDSIQTTNHFLLIDSLRQALIRITQEGFLPTLFFLRFDRLMNVVTPQFLANLEGINDATNRQIAYIFTTYRELDVVAPETFSHASLSLIAHQMYIKPINYKDWEMVFSFDKKFYNLSLNPKIKKSLYLLVDGYIQYLQLSMIILSEQDQKITNKDQLFNLLVADERITLQSEEIWESLNRSEQKALINLLNHNQLNQNEVENAKYIFDTGIADQDNKIFSLLFEYFLTAKNNHQDNQAILEFSKKELSLFNLLKDNLGKVCEREFIIENVWPEEESLGVSDWAIDRLVSRVRTKLKEQKSSYEVITIKTRGFKLVSTS